MQKKLTEKLAKRDVDAAAAAMLQTTAGVSLEERSKKEEPAPWPTLAERIELIWAEVDQLLDKRARELKERDAPNQPIEVLRMSLIRGCRCDTALRLIRGD
jgi:hypothetical protein